MTTPKDLLAWSRKHYDNDGGFPHLETRKAGP